LRQGSAAPDRTAFLWLRLAHDGCTHRDARVDEPRPARRAPRAGGGAEGHCTLPRDTGDAVFELTKPAPFTPREVDGGRGFPPQGTWFEVRGRDRLRTTARPA
jgi:hypothetical protein